MKMKKYIIKSILALTFCLGALFMNGQNNLLVTDYGINQYGKNESEHNFFFQNHFIFELPKFSSKKGVNEDDVMNELTIKLANYYKSNPNIKNLELRLTHDVNTGSYLNGNVGYQQWSEKYHAAAQRGILRVKENLNLNTLAYAGSNGGRMIVNAGLTNFQEFNKSPFDAIIFDEPQVLSNDFRKFTNHFKPENITVINYDRGLNGNFRDLVPFHSEMISQPNAAVLFPEVRFYNLNPPTQSLIPFKTALNTHIYAATHPFEYISTSLYNHSSQRYTPFPNSRLIDLVNYKFHEIASLKQTTLNQQKIISPQNQTYTEVGGVLMPVEIVKKDTADFKLLFGSENENN